MTQVTAAFGMKDVIEFGVERFGDVAQGLWNCRFALDKIMQIERSKTKTPADVYAGMMVTIGDRAREKAMKDLGSRYGISNGNLDGITEILLAIRAMPDWQKRLTVPSSKLNETEAALMTDLAEGGDELAVPADATIKTSPVLKRVMTKLGLRGPEGINRAKMIISRASQVREQQQAFAKTQAAIAKARTEAGYLQLLRNGSWNFALGDLTKAGATANEAYEMAKADLKEVAIAIVDDEEYETLVMMIPESVLPADEAEQWKAERAQAQKTTKKATAKDQPAKEKPAPKKKSAKKAAPAVELAPTPIEPIAEAAPEQPVAAVVAEEKLAEPEFGAAPEKLAEELKAEEELTPAGPAAAEPVDNVTEQLKSARRKELLAQGKKQLRKRVEELKIVIPAEISAATGENVAKAKEWLTERIIEKEYATPTA